jgi:hypothetical protein
MNELLDWLTKCTHTYELLISGVIIFVLLRFISQFNLINKTSLPASHYTRQAFLPVFLQYPLYDIKDKNWQRCTPHDVASMDDESSDSPHTKKPVSSTFLGLGALVPTSVQTCRAERRPWRRDDVIRDSRGVGQARRNVSLGAREKENASHLPACPHYTHTLATMPLIHLAVNHSWQKRATTL